MKSDYRKLKITMLLQVLAAAGITAIVGSLISRVFIDGVLQDPFANSFIAFCRIFLSMNNNDAVYLYRQLFQNNKDFILISGFLILLLIFLFFAISRFVHYFNQISEGVDKLLEDSEQPIVLKPELAAMQTKLNIVKATLKERKNAAIESEQRKNDLVVYLAHDLKTPLTSVIGYLSLLQEAPDMPTEQRAKYTSISLNKALRLEELINEFFDITRFNHQNILLEESQINLSMMLEQFADEFYPILDPKNQKITVDAGDDIIIYGDANKLARVFNNVLKNAALYSHENSTIEMIAKKQDQNVIITFKSWGKIIPSHKLDTIFEKFYRLDSSRSSNTGGAGLGLAIAKEIVELHQGTISAQSNEEFTEFMIILPISS